jgi:6-phosphogluconolactonase
MPEIEIFPDPSSLATRAAEVFVGLAAEALKSHGRFTVALAGGTTPEKTYALLGEAQLNWSNIHVFWGDERCVPPDHAESNYGKAARILLDRIAIPRENVHRIHGELPAEEAAHDYELALCRLFGAELPRFDLVLLGLGTDGHTASLFPGIPALKEKNHWAVSVIHRILPPPPVDRITLTPLVLNAAANVIFLVSGSDKAEILNRVMKSPDPSEPLPAQAIRPGSGRLRWFLDRSAAARLASGRHGKSQAQ